RLSATFKDVPGGQLLGPTFDYTHRLLDFSLLAEGQYPGPQTTTDAQIDACPRVLGLLAKEGLIKHEADDNASVADITRDPLEYPASRAERLQALARGDEG
ncbi:carbon-phosphorus lyase complex subunit PhnI, partial [Salmonella enterica]